MTKLSINDWLLSPSIQLIPVITSDTSDKEYHDHDFFEIFYVLEGSIIHNCNNQKEKLVAGDARLIRPKDKHGFIREQNTPCAHRDIIITEQLFKKSCDFIDPTLFDKINNQTNPLAISIPQIKVVEFEKDFSNMFFMPAETGIYSKVSITNILTVELLNVFLQGFEAQHNIAPAWLNTILPFFHTPVYMRGGLDTILCNIGYDKSYICRIFKKYMGCTMTEYLREKRVDYAMSLLLTTDKTIAEICHEVGFESVPYFTAAFKEKYILPPKQFKLKFFRR